MTQTEMRDHITAATEAATDQFAASNPGRLDQMLSSAQSILMAIDALFTEVPYRS
jgi:hypothetical protein